MELGAHLDHVTQFCLFIVGDDRRTENDVTFTGGCKFRFKNTHLLQTFAELFDGNIAVMLEIVFDLLFFTFIGQKFKIELHTAVEVQSQTDGAGRFFTDEAHHIAVVLQILALDHRSEVDTALIGSLEQRLGFKEVLVFRLISLGSGDQLGSGLIRLILEQRFKGIIIISGGQRIHRRTENHHYNDGEQGAEQNRFFVHNYFLS